MSKLMQENKIEAVVHFAASCYVGESEKDPFKYFNNNVGQTSKLLEAMAIANVKRIVFSSSCATYGTPEFVPLTEEHKQAPINAYGQTKLIVEYLLQTLHRTLGFSYVALRYFNAAGADESGEIGESHDPETHLIPKRTKSDVWQMGHLEIFGNDYDTRDGTCIRDYVHVNDLAKAHIAALELTKNECCGIGINLGTGYGASVKEVGELCAEIAGFELETKILARREGDPAMLLADYAKAEKTLGWKPSYDLRKIIETAWNWEKNRRY